MMYLKSIPWHDLFLLLLLAFGGVMLWKWHKAEGEFELQQFLVDNSTGKLAIDKVGATMAIGVSSWIMVGLFNKGQMTEGYMTTYLGALLLARAVSSGISVAKDVKMPATAAPLPLKEPPTH